MTDQSLQLPDRPFHVRELAGLGLTRNQLRALVATGAVRRLGRAVYVDGALTDSVALRARAVALVAPPDHVVCDRSAAWIHGVDTFTRRDEMPLLETCGSPGGKASSRAGVDGHTRDLSPRDVTTIDGIKVTTPMRTALDLGCRLERKDALAAMDALCRLHELTRQDLARELRRFRRRRGVIRLRELARLVDPRAESARESWTRLAIHDAGLPVPQLQHWVIADGARRYRLDLAYPDRRIAIEYDGFDSHRRSPEQLERDAERRLWLHEHGWTVIVVRTGDFTGAALDRWLNEVRYALAPTYSNVRRLERGDRARHAARISNDGA